MPEYINQAEKRAELARKAYNAYMDLVLAGGGTPWDETLGS